MAGIQFLQSLLQQATARGARSTVLTDLRWFLAIILPAWLFAAAEHLAGWIVLALGIVAGLGSLLYITAYVFFAFTDPDALRSEKFSLSKMVIEKTLSGDDMSGLVETDEIVAPPVALLPNAAVASDDEVG